MNHSLLTGLARIMGATFGGGYIPMATNGEDVPECQRCGCPDVAIERRRGYAGRRLVSLVCQHCGRRWRWLDPTPVAETVVYPRVAVCPGCSQPGRVTSTRDGFRYAKCEACGLTFKQVGRRVNG